MLRPQDSTEDRISQEAEIRVLRKQLARLFDLANNYKIMHDAHLTQPDLRRHYDN